MPVTIDGSPTHVLIVHVVVVLLPMAIIASLVLVAIPATRRAFSLLTLLIAFVACAAIPLAFSSGSNLEARLPSSPLIRRHVQLAHQLLPLAAAFGLALAAYVALDLAGRARAGRLNDLEQRFITSRADSQTTAIAPRWTASYRISAAVLVVLAILTAVQVYRVGDAGAKAAWSGRLSNNPPVISTAHADTSRP